MSFKVQFHQPQKNQDIETKESLKSYLQDFLTNNPRKDIFSFKDSNQKLRKELTEKYKHKKHFIHVGMGGSALGPEFFIKALYPQNTNPHFLFFNNIDSDEIYAQLSSVNLNESLFYIVSKSGSTIETLSLLAIIDQELTSKFGKNYNKNDFFVFCTDPDKSFLKDLAQEWSVPCLEISPNIGGRYSTLTDVGLFPLNFIGKDQINSERVEVAKELEKDLNQVIDLAAELSFLYKKEAIDQTVLMPYSSLLKTFSLWFVQLWAESLGKTPKGKNPRGLTPIFAYGPTDQHSQVQLFMEGPRNKAIIFLEVSETQKQYKFESSIPHEKIKLINGKNLQNVLLAELSGSRDALIEREIPCFTLQVDQITSKEMIKLVLFCELLTISVAKLIEVDPFDQPGVELGKLLCLNYLKS